MREEVEKEVDQIVELIVDDYQNQRAIDYFSDFNQPNHDSICGIVDKLFQIVYPGYFRDKVYKIYNLKNHIATIIEDVTYRLTRQVAIALKYRPGYESKTHHELHDEAADITLTFLSKIPKVREYVDTDLDAAFEGDPAAGSKDEIIFAYPGLYAITVNRIAHELYLLDVPVIPRIMTEYAHGKTGIDIHPGATIGKYFFIDHGTGIVVGETTTIGEHVKIYQGVTLGALSTRGGQKLRSKKRHPTICDNVTIYSGASVLGGDTVIGENVVIGGNAFITKSIEKNMRVSVKSQELQIDSASHSVVKKDLEQDEFWNYSI
ncbi:MAG: serine O-acetyltransferase [Lachnospiraceae bacterium]